MMSFGRSTNTSGLFQSKIVLDFSFWPISTPTVSYPGLKQQEFNNKKLFNGKSSEQIISMIHKSRDKTELNYDLIENMR